MLGVTIFAKNGLALKFVLKLPADSRGSNGWTKALIKG